MNSQHPLMKFAFVFLFFLPILIYSQKFNKRDVSTTTLNASVYDLTQETLAPANLNLPFSYIKVLDARFDTSKLGYELHKRYDYTSYKDFNQIQLSQGVQRSLELFYNDYYQLSLRDSLKKLLIVLKTFWIDHAPANRLEGETGDITESNSLSFQNIYVKWEYYFQENDRYYPFKRIDTVYRMTNPILRSQEYKFKKNDLSFFMFVLKSQLEQLNFDGINAGSKNRNGLSFHSIDSFNKKRFMIPIVNATEIRQGIFLTFEEFKNNSPSIQHYELKKIRKEMFWIDSKTLQTVPDYYLLCDSIGLHTGATKRVSVYQVGNTFEFFGLGNLPMSNSLVKNLMNSSTLFNYNRPFEKKYNFVNGGELENLHIPRQINMETGEIY